MVLCMKVTKCWFNDIRDFLMCVQTFVWECFLDLFSYNLLVLVELKPSLFED